MYPAESVLLIGVVHKAPRTRAHIPNISERLKYHCCPEAKGQQRLSYPFSGTKVVSIR